MIRFLVLLFAWTLVMGKAEEVALPIKDVMELANLTVPPKTYPVGGGAEGGKLKAIYFDALPWKGKPTRVYAWLGFPEKGNGKVPGVVLVHGGGGTAFKEWVQRWNERGFAAIAIAVEGQTDEKAPGAAKGTEGRAEKGAIEGYTITGWRRHEWSGPERKGIYGDTDEPLKDQWMYHAVADTILANTLLRSFPEVDVEKVGIMGISWGGVITSTVIGIDTRWAFAVATYGCGHLFDNDNMYGKALGENRLYKEVWDPFLRMNRVKTPTLWFSWPQDQHFDLNCQAACYRQMTSPHQVCLIPEMKHGHGPAWNAPHSYTFAESVIQSGKPWCIQSKVTTEGDQFTVHLDSQKDLQKAVLISTADSGFTGKRKWIESSVGVEKEGNLWKIKGVLPTGTTAWYVNVKSGEEIASTDLQGK